MAEIDAKTKEYMSDNERFADVFNFYIYDGQQVIQPQKLRELDTTALILPYGTQDTSGTIQKYRDVLKYASAMYDEQAAYLLLGIENQSHMHYAMPVRNMLYDAAQYAKQVESAAASHRKAARQGEAPSVSSDEFLSGFYKEDRLLPVITLVIYWSPDEWDAPLSIHEMLAVKDKALLALTPDYKINLIAPGRIADADFGKFKTTLAQAFQYIKYSKDDAALEQTLETDPKFHALDRRTAELINSVTGSQLKFQQNEEVVDMCVAIENMKQKAATAAAEKASQEATKTDIRNLMETLRLTQEQAMDALKIPEDQRAEYAQELQS
jgi:hypothetical protein